MNSRKSYKPSSGQSRLGLARYIAGATPEAPWGRMQGVRWWESRVCKLPHPAGASWRPGCGSPAAAAAQAGAARPASLLSAIREAPASDPAAGLQHHRQPLQDQHRKEPQRGMVIVKWTVVAALGFFAVLILERLAVML
jgi:hypothetical protein